MPMPGSESITEDKSGSGTLIISHTQFQNIDIAMHASVVGE
jgi:hypothetical protein